MSETRKLTAILVADVVGYSRLAGGVQSGPVQRNAGGRKGSHAETGP